MNIQIKGARENNLKEIDIDINDGLTAVTGVSGSGKSSLVFDTIYHEARRRFLEQFASSSRGTRLEPAKVKSIKGLGPAIAVGQNLLNRNPNSILATASGIHPLLRLLYARFGKQKCPNCHSDISIISEDEIIEMLLKEKQNGEIVILTQLVKSTLGSHKTLLIFLEKEFSNNVIVDGEPYNKNELAFNEAHDIDIKISTLNKGSSINEVRNTIEKVKLLGTHFLKVKTGKQINQFSLTNSCSACGTFLFQVEPKHFNMRCPYCKGKGCDKCSHTGMLPLVSDIKIGSKTLPQILELSVENLITLLKGLNLPISSERILQEIIKRLAALLKVGLGYLTLNRSSPSLSRGEAQRVRIALTLINELEDILYVLDEPTIGQHPYDVNHFLPNFRNLKGSVIYVEYDKLAVSIADNVIDLGPEGGQNGGEITFLGSPAELWISNSLTGKYFSSKEKVILPELRQDPTDFISIKGAMQHNLKNINVKIPLHCISVVTGVSGSGKSTLVEDVIYRSISEKKPIGCIKLYAPEIKAVMIDQSPIGKNPRSNPATYTEIADIMRKLFEKETGLNSSHFSFNRPEGACPTCKGMGAIEVKMKYLPSTWIPCSDCNQQRFKEEILNCKIKIGDKMLSIANLYDLSIAEVNGLFISEKRLSLGDLGNLKTMLKILVDIGLGYLSLGQPSPSLSGGEAQRIKLAKYLGKKNLTNHLIILDEPSTGLHSKDIENLLKIFDRLTREGASILIVEHNIDIIKAADWIIDLGPHAGELGGKLIYSGKLNGLLTLKDASLTSKAIIMDGKIKPSSLERKEILSDYISIKKANANNLKNIDLEIPKNKITTITGVSGSGKSSLVIDVIEAEARRRFLETLSMYERQGTKEKTETKVESISGLGITSSITPIEEIYFTHFKLRNTIGIVTEISYHISILLAFMGQLECPKCGFLTKRQEVEFKCPKCEFKMKIPKPSYFHTSSYVGVCTKCHGVGTLQESRPEKLIIDPNKPICKGAMYSPGFFPKGYLCKPYNGGYYMLQALAKHYKFDPFVTPWNEMSKQAQQAFLHGDKTKLKVIYENRKGQIYEREELYPGFYEGYIRDWDIGGTYTETILCPSCNGAKLKQEYLSITLGGNNIHQLSEIPLVDLLKKIETLELIDRKNYIVKNSKETIIKRIQFLIKTGLGYVKLNRIADSLSAGEAQRVRLAGLLGSELSALTILLDEPSRGLHPTELDALLDVLRDLRDMGNTLIIVEHDMQLIKNSDFIIDLGPGAGINGGQILAQGTPKEVIGKDSITAKWMRGGIQFIIQPRIFKPKKWLEITGAKENNLKGDLIRIPHNYLVGICGVSGSGKSSLIVDTLGRILSPRKQTTSVAYEPIVPGKYHELKGKLSENIVIDQSKEKVKRPLKFLELDKELLKIYSNSEEAQLKGYSEKDLNKKCSVCNGKGIIKTEMGFLPDIVDNCEICDGTGYSHESWEVRINGFSLPELNHLTFDEIGEIFADVEPIKLKVDLIKKVGLGYLVLNQPLFTLSGGEVQRLKIVKELSRKNKKKTLYILDEPTIGQHLEDVSRLIKVLQNLVDEGHTVVAIEHHPHFLASCDWLIELGPVGGPKGGYVIAAGPPSDIAKMNTPTAPYLKSILEASQ